MMMERTQKVRPAFGVEGAGSRQPRILHNFLQSRSSCVLERRGHRKSLALEVYACGKSTNSTNVQFHLCTNWHELVQNYGPVGVPALSFGT